MKTNTLVWIILSLSLVATASLFGTFYLSVIGDEGFKQYDPLLYSGSFDSTLLQQKGDSRGTISVPGDGSITFSQPNCNEVRCSSEWIYGELWLDDFKADYKECRGYSSRYHEYSGTSSVLGVVLAKDDSTVSPNLPQCTTGTIEVRWDNYEQGHYIILKNGIVMKEGTTTKPLPIAIRPQNREQNRPIPGNITLSNIRIKKIFSCDLQPDEAIVTACFGGEQTITTDDLPGFSRFCLDFPAKYNHGGLVSASNRVYYSLASGEPVIIAQNDAWEFSYVASGDYNGETAISSQCDDAVIVPNIYDLNNSLELAAVNKLRWAANGDYTSLSSGEKTLMTTTPPGYSCRSIDGHAESGDSILYPNPQQTCWHFNINNEPINIGEERIFNPFTVRLADAKAQITYDDGLFGGYREPDDWQLVFDVKVDDFIDIGGFSRSDDGFSAVITNNYDDVLVNFLIVYTPAVIDDQIVVSKELMVPKGNSILLIDEQRKYSGKYEVSVKPLLKIGETSVSAGQATTFSYEVVNGNANGQVENEETPIIQHWWEKLWTWILSLFAI